MSFEDPFKRIKKEVKKAVLTGTALFGMSTMIAAGQEINQVSKESSKPPISLDTLQKGATVLFEEDSLIAKKPSTQHPGLYALYFKNSDTNLYEFQEYQDEKGNSRNPEKEFEDLRKLTLQAKETYPETEAKKEFEQSRDPQYQLERALAAQNKFILELQGELDIVYPNPATFYEVVMRRSTLSDDEKKKLQAEFESGNYETYNQECAERERQLSGLMQANEDMKKNPERLIDTHPYEWYLKQTTQEHDEAVRRLSGQ